MVRLWAALMDVGPPPASASASASTHTHARYLANFAYVCICMYVCVCAKHARASVSKLRVFFAMKNICANKSAVTGFLRCMSQEKMGLGLFSRIIYSPPRHRVLCTRFDCVERNGRILAKIAIYFSLYTYISPNEFLCHCFAIKKIHYFRLFRRYMIIEFC